MSNEPTYPCTCYGYIMFDEPPGSHDICGVCAWEDDDAQLRWPQSAQGANDASLIEAQTNYVSLGASLERRLHRARKPTPSDRREPGWRPIDLAVDDFEPTGTGDAPHPSDSTALYWWRPTFWRLRRHG